MYRYRYNTSYHHKSRRAKRTTKLAVFLSVLVFIAAAGIGYDLIKQYFRKDSPVSQAEYSTVEGASINLFRTEFFQFQTDRSWQEVPSESKPGKYVYRSFSGPLVEHDIVIEVNNTTEVALPLVRTTRVMPVQLESNGRISPVDGAGEHCGAQLPKTTARVPLRVTQKQVSFVCSVDAVVYQVDVGVVGGTTSMSMVRPDGTRAVYHITYRNLKFTPSDEMLKAILGTFQTR